MGFSSPPIFSKKLRAPKMHLSILETSICVGICPFNLNDAYVKLGRVLQSELRAQTGDGILSLGNLGG